MATQYMLKLVVSEEMLNELLYALDNRMDIHWQLRHTYEMQDNAELTAEHRRLCKEVGTMKRTIVSRKELVDEVLPQDVT